MHPALQDKVSAMQGRSDLVAGRYSYGNPTVISYPGSTPVIIGAFVQIAGGVTFVNGGEHQHYRGSTYPFDALFPEEGYECSVGTKGQITIGNDVWIGHGVTILSGVTVGNGAVIGAGSVVVQDVPAYSVVGGNPAKVLRERFPPQVVQELEASRWWERPLHEIKQMVDAEVL